MIRLFTDTSANLSAEYIAQYDIRVIPFHCYVDGQAFEGAFDGQRFYAAMRDGADTKTSMINTADFAEAFETALNAGEDVLYVGMSGGISGAAGAAAVAADCLRDEYKERQIAVIDSLGASLGEGLLVLEAAECLAKGMDLSDICRHLLTKRAQLHQYFTVDDLKYLRRGGRISAVAASVGSMLSIKPILMGDPHGKIIVESKVRGAAKALAALSAHYARQADDKSARIGIAHADNEAAALALLEKLRQQGFCGECITEVYEPVTGSHVGPGALALFFFEH